MRAGKNWNPNNKYYTMTPEEIKTLWTENASAVSSAGTDMHYNIECFMNQPIQHPYTHTDLYNHHISNLQLPNEEPKEWTYFLKYVQAFPDFRPYRTEWMIYDEDVKISGSIDMVYENEDGTLSIYDWKRAKEISKTTRFNKYATNAIIDHIPDTNFWHYSLQLNTYKAILERKYKKQIKDLYLVRLHPNNPRETFDLIKCANLQDEVAALFEDRLTKQH
jgi:ATP-dependent exoDNAse (exonuclease V) beta subunit